MSTVLKLAGVIALAAVAWLACEGALAAREITNTARTATAALQAMEEASAKVADLREQLRPVIEKLDSIEYEPSFVARMPGVKKSK
jgi:hypothetical protein